MSRKLWIMIVALIFCSCTKNETAQNRAASGENSRVDVSHENYLRDIKKNQGYYIVKEAGGNYVDDRKLSEVLELSVADDESVIIDVIYSVDNEELHGTESRELYTQRYKLDYDGSRFVCDGVEPSGKRRVITLDFGENVKGDLLVTCDGNSYEKIDNSYEYCLEGVKKNQGYYIAKEVGNNYFFDWASEILEMTVDTNNSVIVNKIDFINGEKIIEQSFTLEYDGTKFANGDIWFNYIQGTLGSGSEPQAIEYARFVKGKYLYAKINYEADRVPAIIWRLSSDFRKSLVGEYVFDSVEIYPSMQDSHAEDIETIDEDVKIYVMYDQRKKRLWTRTNRPQFFHGLNRENIEVAVNGTFALSYYCDIFGDYYFVNDFILKRLNPRNKDKENFGDGNNYIVIEKKEDGDLLCRVTFVKNPALWENPYLDGNGAVIERFETKERMWTVRKLEQELTVGIRDGSPLINVHKLPGITEQVLFQLDNGLTVETLAITDESETIGDLTSPWVKVCTVEGGIGWVFGAHTGVKDRSGPKFLTPENIEKWQEESGIRPFIDLERTEFLMRP